jgi:WD40 repeat protein
VADPRLRYRALVRRATRNPAYALIAASIFVGCASRSGSEPLDLTLPTETAPVPSVSDDGEAPPELVQRIDGMALPEDGRSLWVCADGLARQWSWDRGTTVRLEARCDRGLRVSADGSTVVTSSERQVWVHRTTNADASSQSIELELEPDEHLLEVALSRGGRRAAVTTTGGDLKVVELDTGKVRALEMTARPGALQSAADDSILGRLGVARGVAVPQLGWSGDEATLVVAAAVREVEAERVSGRVFTWRVDDASFARSDPFDVLDPRMRGHLAMAVSPTDRRFVVGTADGSVRLFDQFRLVWASTKATAYPMALAFSADGQRFAAAYADGAVRIFGPLGTPDALEMWPDVDDVARLAFSPGGDRLVLTVRDGPMAIIDASSGELLARVAVLDRGWVTVSARGTVDGTQSGLQALRHAPIADALGWDRGQRPAPHLVAGLLGDLLDGSSPHGH